MREVIWAALSKAIKKLALKRVFGSIVGGIQGFLASFLVEKLINKLVKPAYLWITRKIMMVFKKKEIKKSVEDLKNAKTEKEFDSSVDNLK